LKKELEAEDETSDHEDEENNDETQPDDNISVA